MNHEPHIDDDMGDDERELAALFATLPATAPDARLDAAVLAKARVVHRRRWPVALATAATVMLALGVGWQWRISIPVSPEGALPPRATEPTEAVLPPAPAMPAPALLPAPEQAEARKTDGVARSTMPPELRRQRNAEAPTAVASPKPMAVPVAAAKMPMPPAPPAPPAAPALPSTYGVAVIVDEASSEVMPPMGTAAQRVERIRLLQRHGQHDVARAEFKALREAFPAFVVPADLGPLAR